MKKYIVLLLILSSVKIASAQRANNQAPYLTKPLSGPGIKNIFVETSGGSIAVSGNPNEQPRVEVYVQGNNNQDLSKEEIARRLNEDYKLDIDIHDGEVHATARNRRTNMDWRRSLSIGFKIFVNRQTATNLTTSGGSIHLNSLTGDQTFTTSGGSLHVDDVAGNIKGTTSGGSINVSNSKQEMELVTSGGSITADNCMGMIRLVTSGGSLHLSNLRGNINASTSGGSVQGSNIDGTLETGTSGGSVNLTAISGSLNAFTSAGSIHVQMKQVGKYVKLNAGSGHVDIGLPLKQSLGLDIRGSRVNQHPSTLSDFSGEWEKDRIKGTVNGGGSLVEVNGDGRVNLSFQ